ncbi:hypothetical protein ACHAP8_000724 [Fusarium lateritium]
MNTPQSSSFAASEFITENPGRPVAQKYVRRRGLNDQIKWVRSWMAKLPQGDEDWDNNRPSTPEDILRLHSRLTISHIGSRRNMDWYTLLDTYAAASKDFEPGRETQTHCMVMVALCHVAHSQGLTTDEVMTAMAKCVSGGSDTLRSKRFALPKCVQIGDELEKVLGPRAYELPLRAFYHRMLQNPTRRVDVCPSPEKQSTGGQSRTSREGPRARSDEVEGEIEIEVKFEGVNDKIDKQLREQ